MSEVLYHEIAGRRVPYVAPRDVSGFARSPQEIRHSKSVLTRGMNEGYLGIRQVLHARAHEDVFRSRVLRFAPPESATLQRTRRQYENALRAAQGLEAQGESNRVMPDRGSFAAKKKSKHRVEEIESYSRGEQVVHNAAHTRLTIMGPSRSKPGFYKAVDLEGNVFRVSPRNISRLR